ncbi:NIPSNAP family protein [Fulvivirga lutimaris]|uniref:NIPSNAP family protein n=1 Tax=Fulvivirga lutimaris TaxID=1819566 RepID=UPI0012BBB0B1|nr:NIPSNAP family protein [Fulvivirga lutimaris]MTI38943.1 NIPSNAP family containing protein [Fulvivirga lutimaris]
MRKQLLIILILVSTGLSANAQEQVYEFRTYELDYFKSADVLHNYLEKALIPALNRQGVKNVGVFEETSNTLPKKIYLLIPYKSIVAFQSSGDVLLKDEQYLKDAAPYLKADPDSMPYDRINTDLIRSSKGFPNLVKPTDDLNLFELRIYDSYNEDALRRKVKMFDDHEFDIFAEVGMSMVFFGANVAGDKLPALTYLLAFGDMKERDEEWAKFVAHPEWKRILGLEEYANAMNEITRIFLRPLSYSQL